jgi:hypothetical protein
MVRGRRVSPRPARTMDCKGGPEAAFDSTIGLDEAARQNYFRFLS